MAQYDGSIRINTKIDTKDVPSQLMKLENSMQKVADKVTFLRQKMESLKDVKIPTQEYQEIQKQIEATEKKINDLLAHQEKFLAAGGKKTSSTYKNMEYDLDELRNSLPYLQGELQDLVDTGKAFTLGTDTEQYSKLGQELKYAENNLLALNRRHDELVAKQGNVSERFSKMKDSAKKAFNALGRGISKSSGLFSLLKNSADRTFQSVSKGARQSTGLLSAFASRLKGLAASAFIFNLLSKGFNSMVSSMKTGFTNLMAYSGSFANSIQSVKNSLGTLGNQIAAAFVPIVQAVIPWLNQLISVISTAMSYVAQFIAALTGRSSYVRAKKVQDSYNASLGDTSSKAEDAADSAGDMADSLDDTAKAAKRAKGELAAFDDLDVLEKQDESTDAAADKIKDLNDQLKDLGSGAGGGMGDLFEEVPIESSILDAVEKLKDILAQLFAPLKEAWEREGKFVMDSWEYALKEVWQLIKDIGRDFLTVWNQEETIQALANILHIIGDIGLAIGNTARALDEAWNKNNTGLHILENIRDIFAVIIRNIREAADFTVEWSKALDFTPLLKSIEHLTRALVPFADFVSGTLADFYTQFILPLTSWVLSEEGLPRLINILGDFMGAVDWEALRGALKNLYTALEPYAEAIGEGLIDFIEKIKNVGIDILNAMPGPIQKLADALKSGDPGKVRGWTTAILEFVSAATALKAAFTGFEIVEKGLTLLGFGGEASSVGAAGEAIAGTAAKTSIFSKAVEGLGAIAGYAGTTLAAFGTASLFVDNSLDEMGKTAGANKQQIATLSDRYDGLGGKLNVVKDAFSLVGNAMDGFGFNASNTAGQIGALETVMNNIAAGTIYTDSQLEKLQTRFGLTDEDIEMLRQSMLDTNEPLRQLADDFGLFDASVETLQMVQEGMKLVEDGTITAAEAFDEFSKPMWGMNDSALAFFQTLSGSGMTIGEYKASLENASEATQQFSDDMKEAGENISTGITEGFENANVETPTRGFFAKIVESLRSVFNMHSPAKNMEPFGENILLGVLEGFKNTFGKVGDFVAKLLQSIQKFFSDTWSNIQKNTTEVWTKIQEWFTRTMHDIQKFFTDIWTDIQNWFTGFWNRFTKSLQEVWENITSFLKRKLEEISTFFRKKIEEISTFFRQKLNEINTFFRQKLEEIYNFFRSKMESIASFFRSKIEEIRNFFSNFISFVSNLVSTRWSNAWDTATNIFSNFKSRIEGIVDGIKSTLGSFVSWVSDIVSRITSTISRIGESVSSANSSVGQLSEVNVARSVSYDMAASHVLDDVPRLASGSVIRGGNPFMAMLGDQPHGQMNVEAPLSTIKQAIREELSDMDLGSGQAKIVLNLNGIEVGEALVDDLLSVMKRKGYDTTVLGVT